MMASQDDSQNVKDATKRAEDSMNKLKERAKMIGKFITKKSKILATALVAFSVSTSGAFADCDALWMNLKQHHWVSYKKTLKQELYALSYGWRSQFIAPKSSLVRRLKRRLHRAKAEFTDL